RPVIVGGLDGSGEGLLVEGRHQVAGITLDPVTDQLHPAVATLRLLGYVRRQLGGLELVGVVPDVALGPGRVAAGANEPGQGIALPHPARVRGGSTVTKQPRACVPVGGRLALALVVVGSPLGVQADVTVSIDEPWDDPSLGDRLGSRLRLVGDRVTDD